MRKISRRRVFNTLGSVSIITVFSLFAWSPLIAGEKDTLMIERFSGEKDGDGIPLGWKLEKKKGKADIKIEKEGDNSYLHFVCNNSSFGINKEIEFKIEDFPILSWRWKVTKLPKGGDVRKKSSDDQAAQVYVAFPKFPAKVNTRLVGYIWENEAPKGSMVTSQQWSKLKYVVLRDKTDVLDQWVTERRNVYEDYKKLFEEEPPKVGGFSLYINSQRTESTAESCFDDVYFTKE